MTKRAFIYNDLTFEDPGDAYSNDAVRQHLASQYYPELAQCDIKVDAEKDGVIPVRFVKRITTKSNGQNALALLNALQMMPLTEAPTDSAAHPLFAKLGSNPTVAAILNPANAELIDDYLTQLDSLMANPPVQNEVMQWHCQLPTGFAPVPIGF